MQIGDSVKLVRKITGEVLLVELTHFSTKLAQPAVEVRWKSDRHRYKLDLVKNEVLAIDSTQNHRQSMRAWYLISEDHRKELTENFWNEKRKGK